MIKRFLLAVGFLVVSSPLVFGSPSSCAKSYQAFEQGKWAMARDLAGPQCAIISETATWILMQEPKSDYTFNDIMAFIAAHPHWPKRATLRLRAEESMTARTPDAQILKWFRDLKPVTGAGSLYYADALIRAGRTTQATSFIRHIWQTQTMGVSDSAHFRQKFKSYLRAVDDVKRVDELLWQENIPGAKALVPILPPHQKQWATIRLALLTGGAGADKQAAAFLPQVRHNGALRSGLLYDHLKYLRKKESAGVYAFYHKIPAADRAHHIYGWWGEKNILCRRAIADQAYVRAYNIAKNHHLTEGSKMAEAEFLLGWLQFSFLKNPAAALPHFQTLNARTKRPQSQARAGFWLGVVHGALGQKTAAQQWFQAASRYQSTFYGQLASDKIHKPIHVGDPKIPTTLQRQYDDGPLARVSALLYKAGHKNKGRDVLNHMQTQAKSQDQALALISLTGRLDPDHKGWIIGDISADRELLIKDAYPMPPLPKTPVPSSLIYAIIRQESCFNPSIISFDFGHGLMQLMEETAKKIAKTQSVPFSKDRLTRDPAYNMALGIAYINELLQEMNGGQVLAIPSYNAGPGAVKKWIAKNGDPRHFPQGSMELINWIERIPFFVTRTYVQRVLANKKIYDTLVRQ